jgi:hypothetical protein
VDNKKLINTINKYLNKETFDVPIFMGVPDITISSKIELTGEKQLITVGEWKNYITYTMYILKDDNDIVKLVSQIIGNNRELNVTTSYSNNTIFNFSNFLNNNLKSLFDYFGVDDYPILTKIINENISEEEIIKEGKYDGVTRRLVRDIIDTFKNKKVGEFLLPEELPGNDDEMTYDFINLNPLTVRLQLIQDNNVDEFELDGNYVINDDVIEIQVVYNPNKGNSITQELIGELNETIRHELEHLKQYMQGATRKRKSKDPFKYFQRKGEFEAQLAGFKRRAKQERRSVEDVARRWFEKYQKRHNLTSTQIDKIVNQLIS